MKGPATVAHSLALPRSQNTGSLLLLALALLLPVGALAQEPNGSAATPPVQTAARARVPAQPSPQSLASKNSASALPSLVSFADGQLSINAANVSLSDVLFAVRAATGADIDVPNNASSERVTAQLGPGPARKVLADLLGWSSFDYIIQASDEDPLAVHSVTLLVRVKGPASASQPTSSVIATTRPPADVPAAQAENEPIAAGVVESAAPEVRPDRPASIQEKLGNGSDLQSSIAVSGSNAAAGSSPNTSVGQSPADMIQQLQQMYQQRRALQQQQNQAAGQRSP